MLLQLAANNSVADKLAAFRSFFICHHGAFPFKAALACHGQWQGGPVNCWPAHDVQQKRAAVNISMIDMVQRSQPPRQSIR